ncbi:hypothetical protein HMPREF9248_1059 [Fannyhessea vaginae PB189-T1-4]|uniref:Uncharacterized protein n=1 Tax=Fannyhessea vaginae PB189-T1-4 TaxID=866774 RepID=A0ABN0B0L4_9ACTN|nr:hypothetical protein HMPREF9248_1059 [Fannyhessea vaginae PB189-T1-4]
MQKPKLNAESRRNLARPRVRASACVHVHMRRSTRPRVRFQPNISPKIFER